MDPYSVLGIKYDASIEEIKRAYRRLCDKYTLELTSGRLKEEAEESLNRVHKAYEVLMKKKLRFHRNNVKKYRDKQSLELISDDIVQKSFIRKCFEFLQKKR